MSECGKEVELNGELYVRKCDIEQQDLNDDNYVVVRTYSAGVHIGTLKSEDGKRVVLKDSRRVWYWRGAETLSQLAVDGTKNPNKCKITVVVPEIILTEAIEIIPCTKKASKSLQGVKVWKQ